MIYAYILKSSEGDYSVVYSFIYKIAGIAEKIPAGMEIAETLFEESGDLALLDKLIARWKDARGIKKIFNFSDLGGIAPDPTPPEYIERLRLEIHRLSQMAEGDKETIGMLKEKCRLLEEKSEGRVKAYKSVMDNLVKDNRELVEALEYSVKKIEELEKAKNGNEDFDAAYDEIERELKSEEKPKKQTIH